MVHLLGNWGNKLTKPTHFRKASFTTWPPSNISNNTHLLSTYVSGSVWALSMHAFIYSSQVNLRGLCVPHVADEGPKSLQESSILGVGARILSTGLTTMLTAISRSSCLFPSPTVCVTLKMEERLTTRGCPLQNLSPSSTTSSPLQPA